MKFVMNGGLIIGTLDGANVEIVHEVGEENIFVFGAKIEEIEDLRNKMKETEPEQYIKRPLMEVLESIQSGRFGNPQEHANLITSITKNNDFYLVAHDFYDYAKTQIKVIVKNFNISNIDRPYLPR